MRFDSEARYDAGHRYDELNGPGLASPPFKKEKGKHMDYIPDKRADRYLWLKNLSNNIAVEGLKFGLTAQQCTDIKAVVDALITKMDDTDTAQNAVDSARDLEAQTRQTNEAAIRGAVRNWKTLPGYAASGSEAILQLKGAGVVFDPLTYKPKIKATVLPGQVRLDFTKAGVDGLVFYSRRQGTLPWTKLAMDTNPPYFDTKPLTTANVPEAREYMARGVLDDVEIGLASDIVAATFAG